MYDLQTIIRMNDMAVKKWYESEKARLERLKKEIIELEKRVVLAKAAEEEGTYEP